MYVPLQDTAPSQNERAWVEYPTRAQCGLRGPYTFTACLVMFFSTRGKFEIQLRT